MEKGDKKKKLPGQKENTQVLHKRENIWFKTCWAHIEVDLCFMGSLKDNYIFVYLEEDEVNTRLTSGCYVA